MESSAGKLSFDETKFNESMEEIEQETESGLEMTTRNLTDSVSGSALTTNHERQDQLPAAGVHSAGEDSVRGDTGGRPVGRGVEERRRLPSPYPLCFFKNYSLNEAQNLSG